MGNAHTSSPLKRSLCVEAFEGILKKSSRTESERTREKAGEAEDVSESRPVVFLRLGPEGPGLEGLTEERHAGVRHGESCTFL